MNRRLGDPHDSSPRRGATAATAAPHRSLFVAAGVALLAAGCSGEPAGPAGDETAATAHSFGLLTLRIAPQPGNEPAEPAAGTSLELSATAHLARYRALDPDQVARLLALPLDPQRELPALDECGWFDPTRDADEEDVAHDDEGEIDLLEAGDIRIVAPARSLALRPRSFAGLLPFVSGTVYQEAQINVAAGFEQPIEISAAGGAAVGGFGLRVLLPALPAVGVAAPVAATSAGGGAASGATPALELRWTVARAAAETMYLELQGTERPAGPVLRCNVNDVGRFAVPRRLLDALDPMDTGGVLLEAVRLRRTPFHARGLGEAEVRVIASERQRLATH